MGITSDFPVTRSLALGVAEVSVLDMASAYSVFASGGYKTPAYGILKINTLRGDDDLRQGRRRAARARPERADRRLHGPADARRGHRRHRHARRRSTACRPSARPARPATIATPGSAASPATTSPPSGTATTTTTQTNTLTGGTAAGDDLAEIHGLRAHQYRDQTGLRHRLQARAVRRRRRRGRHQPRGRAERPPTLKPEAAQQAARPRRPAATRRCEPPAPTPRSPRSRSPPRPPETSDPCGSCSICC